MGASGPDLADEPCRALPGDFRERVWAKPSADKDGPLAAKLAVPVQTDTRCYGELILERVRFHAEDLEERAVFKELCVYLADGMATLEAEIGRRGTGRGDA